MAPARRARNVKSRSSVQGSASGLRACPFKLFHDCKDGKPGHGGFLRLLGHIQSTHLNTENRRLSLKEAISKDRDLFLDVGEVLKEGDKWLCGRCMVMHALSRGCKHDNEVVSFALVSEDVEDFIVGIRKPCPTVDDANPRHPTGMVGDVALLERVFSLPIQTVKSIPPSCRLMFAQALTGALRKVVASPGSVDNWVQLLLLPRLTLRVVRPSSRQERRSGNRKSLQCSSIMQALGEWKDGSGSYCCASCGKISGILGYWKKQLTIAKDSRRVDSLCYRIYLSFRLFDGTTRFQELHDIVKDAKSKLETEVGPLSGVSAKMARGIVSRLSVAGAVQALCNAAIEKADKISATLSSASLDGKEGSVPAACKFIFEEVTSSSVVLVLMVASTASSNSITGFKLWYSKTTEETLAKDPISTFPRSQRRILISNLQPCTEYSFRIVSYTENGDLGHSEAKCFTESVEILHKNPSSDVIVPHDEGTSRAGPKDVESDSGFKVRDLGKILRLAWVEERGYLDDISGAELSGLGQMVNPATSKADELPFTSHGLDLNIATVPDLNEDVAPNDSSRDEADHGSGGSENWAQHGLNGEVPAVDSQAEVSRKRPASTEIHDCDSALINISSPFPANKGGAGNLDENFEYCVKMIRMLECEGYIKQEFRLKLLTWFSLRSTDQERRVVNTFIQTLIDDPGSLAGQLVDSFADIINNKKPRNGFCSKLWH